jgi:hypothetical protein
MKNLVTNVGPKLPHDVEGGIERDLMRPFVRGISQ